MVRQLLLTVGLILIATSAFGQDPQAVMHMLLERQMERYQLQQQLERQELEEKLRLRRASDYQISAELARYCRNGEPPCWRARPDILLGEAMRRGLLQYSPPARQTAPGQDCMVIGLGEGDATIDCQ